MADVRTGKSNPESFVAQWKIPVEEQGQRMQGTWTLDSVDDAYTLEGTWNGQAFRLRAVAP
jgi:hypothetical protein